MTVYRRPVATRCEGCGEVKPTVSPVTVAGLGEPGIGVEIVTLGRFCRRCRTFMRDELERVRREVMTA